VLLAAGGDGTADRLASTLANLMLGPRGGEAPRGSAVAVRFRVGPWARRELDLMLHVDGGKKPGAGRGRRGNWGVDGRPGG